MRFRIISSDTAEKITNRRLETNSPPGPHPSTDLPSDISNSEYSWSGTGDKLDYGVFRTCQITVDELTENDNKYDLDQVEGLAATELFRTISAAEVSYDALNNQNFWTYLSLSVFWNFILLREPNAFTDESRSSAKLSHHRFINGKEPRYCIPTRMYWRILALGGLEYAELAHAIPNGIYFWHRNIIGYDIGYYPNIVRSMVIRQKDPDTALSTSDKSPDYIGHFTKDLRRKIANLVPEKLPPDEADSLVDELWMKVHSKKLRSKT